MKVERDGSKKQNPDTLGRSQLRASTARSRIQSAQVPSEQKHSLNKNKDILLFIHNAIFQNF